MRQDQCQKRVSDDRDRGVGRICLCTDGVGTGRSKLRNQVGNNCPEAHVLRGMESFFRGLGDSAGAFGVSSVSTSTMFGSPSDIVARVFLRGRP